MIRFPTKTRRRISRAGRARSRMKSPGFLLSFTGHSARRRACDEGSQSERLEPLEYRRLLTGLTGFTDGFAVDLSDFQVEHEVRTSVAYNPETQLTHVLKVPDGEARFFLGIESAFLSVSDDRFVTKPTADGATNLAVYDLSVLDGVTYGVGTHVSSDREVRAGYLDLETRVETALPHPAQTLGIHNRGTQSSGHEHADLPLFAIFHGSLNGYFVTDISTGQSVHLDFLGPHDPEVFVVYHGNVEYHDIGYISKINADAQLAAGKELTSIGDPLVAWDTRTGQPLAQFQVTPPAPESPGLVTEANVIEFTGIFGGNASRPRVAGLEFLEGSSIELRDDNVLEWLNSLTQTNYIGFFDVDTGQLLPDQFFPGSDAITVELGDDLLTVYNGVVGNPTRRLLLDPPVIEELRVNIWDGDSFIDESLQNVLTNVGITTDFTGYEVISLDSTPDSRGDIRVSMALSDRTIGDNGTVTNTQLVSLTFRTEPLLPGRAIDLGATRIEQFEGGFLPKPVITDAETMTTLVLSPNHSYVTVDSAGVLSEPIFLNEIIDPAFLNANFLTRYEGNVFVGGTGRLDDQQARALLFNLATNELTEIPHPRGNSSTNSALVAVDLPYVAVNDGGFSFVVDSVSGSVVPLEFIQFGASETIGSQKAANDGLVVGTESELAGKFVAWDSATGRQLTQFVDPVVITSSDPDVETSNGIFETTGVFGATGSRGAIAGFEILGSAVDFSSFSVTEKREIGFFSLDTGELLEGQSHSGFNALTTEVDGDLFTVYEAVIGDPLVDLLGPPRDTELRVSVWDGSSFEIEPLADFLLDYGIRTDFTGYEVVGIDSVELASGDWQVSVLLTDETLEGDVINTQLLSLTVPDTPSETETESETDSGSTVTGSPGGGSEGGSTSGGAGSGGTASGGTGETTETPAGNDTPPTTPASETPLPLQSDPSNSETGQVDPPSDDLPGIAFPIVLNRIESTPASGFLSHFEEIQLTLTTGAPGTRPIISGEIIGRELTDTEPDRPATTLDITRDSTPRIDPARISQVASEVSGRIENLAELSREELTAELEKLVEQGLLDADLIEPLTEHFRKQKEQEAAPVPAEEKDDGKNSSTQESKSAESEPVSETEPVEPAVPKAVDVAINAAADFLFGAEVILQPEQ